MDVNADAPVVTRDEIRAEHLVARAAQLVAIQTQPLPRLRHLAEHAGFGERAPSRPQVLEQAAHAEGVAWLPASPAQNA